MRNAKLRLDRSTTDWGVTPHAQNTGSEIVQETRAIPIQGGQVLTYVTKFQFDTRNRLQRMTYPDSLNGEVLTYTYDSGGLASRISGNDDALETNYVARVDYDKFGQRLLLDIGNGTRTT